MERDRRFGALFILFALVLTALMLVQTAARADDAPWLHLVAPEAPAHVTSIPLAEVRGLTGTGERPPAQVVVLVDLSRSTLLPSGLDVDGDGQVGVLRRRFSFSKPWSTDIQDIVARANVLGAERIIKALGRAGAQVGLVSFGERARIGAWIGDPEEALVEARRLGPRAWERQTNLGRGLRVSLNLFEEYAEYAAPGVAPPNGERWIVLVSDGDPTAPSHRLLARRMAVRAATRAAEKGVRIFAFSVRDGPPTLALQQVVEQANGSFVHVRDCADFLTEIPGTQPVAAMAEVALVNATTGAPGQAVRLFADGSFDGYAPLTAGRNLLRVTAKLDSGETLQAERWVEFDPRPARTEDELIALTALRERVRARSLETVLAARAQREPLQPRKLYRHLDLVVEEGLPRTASEALALTLPSAPEVPVAPASVEH